MTKITFFIGGLRGGGAEKNCINIANEIFKRGYEVEIVTLNMKGDVYSSALCSGVKIRNLNVNNARFGVYACYLYLLNEQPSIILSFNRQLSVLLICLRVFLSRKFKLVSRNIIFLSEAAKAKKGIWHGVLVNWLVNTLYPKSDIFIAQSHEMKNDLISYLGIPENKIVVIHNPISKEIESLEIDNFRFPYHQENYILYVGRLEAQKNVGCIIKVFASILKRHSEIRLKIVGQGSLENELKALAVTLNVKDRVDFEGFKKDIISYYLNARLTLLASNFEGFPNVLLESIALGTPVVSYACPSGPSEIIISDVNGYLADNKNISELTRSVEKALLKNWDRQSIIESSKRFSSKAMIDRYLEALDL